MTTTGQSTQISTDQVWVAYYHKLIETVAGSLDPERQAVTLAGKALVADFGNDDPAVAANYIFEAGNMLPAWSADTAPPEGLLCSYAAFLDNIDLGGIVDPDLHSRLHSARTNYNIANKNLAVVRSQAVAAWIQHRQIEPEIGFTAFVKGNFPLYTLAGQFLRGADSEFEALMFEAYGTGYSAIADARNKCGITAGAAATDVPTLYNMPVKRSLSSLATSGGVLPNTSPPPPTAQVTTYAPGYRLDGFSAAYSRWQSNKARGIVAETITVTGGSPTGQWSNCPWPPAGGKFLGDFFKVGTDGALPGRVQPVNTRCPDFSISVSFAGLDTFGITPGGWYDGRIVEKYKNRLLPTAPRLIGKGGSLSLLPTALIIGFVPSIVMKLENSDYNAFKGRCQARVANSLKIGPFRVGDTLAPRDRTGISFDDERSTITIRPSEAALPLLLGVVSTKL
jgi:hypothetical protein